NLTLFSTNHTTTTSIYTLSLHDALPIFNHMDVLERPAERHGSLAQRVLTLRALDVFQHLAGRRLADIEIRIPLQMGVRDFQFRHTRNPFHDGESTQPSPEPVPSRSRKKSAICRWDWAKAKKRAPALRRWPKPTFPGEAKRQGHRLPRTGPQGR